ncbi:MAG: (2Fe-2S) ferredoxin domain-containing protein [Magnetococcales bacterium]|nr:(2Fe-2S) ferredoxin domain-containing protein [Magnetococcales bacterium]
MTSMISSQVLVWVCTKRRPTLKNSEDDNASCGTRGGRAIARALEKELFRRSITVPVVRVDCFGEGCDNGPNVRLLPFKKDFEGVVVEKVPGIAQQIGYILQTLQPPA